MKDKLYPDCTACNEYQKNRIGIVCPTHKNVEIQKMWEAVVNKKPSYCILWFHDWGDWKDDERYDILGMFSAIRGHGILQIRECNQCHKKQIRKEEVYA